MPAPYQRIHVVVNPAAGRNEPILNTLNDVFHPHGIEWDVSVTLRYGDARRFARAAAERGVDLVVGYGGDGTQHEIANALLGTGVMMGILPGGTGNGFATELGVPKTLREAADVLATSREVKHVDVARVGGEAFVQRLYTGIDPEQQTSRELKDKYGLLAYAVALPRQLKASQRTTYRLRLDGRELEAAGIKCYVVNSGRMGTGLTMAQHIDPTDGVLDVFVLDNTVDSVAAAGDRLLRLPTEQASLYAWQAREVTLDVEPAQAVWMDGEQVGQTPVTVVIDPGALRVVVP
jgi:YegS/Rv2252/BmrU family lipid kinase